jgi:hypothetical protein
MGVLKPEVTHPSGGREIPGSTAILAVVGHGRDARAAARGYCESQRLFARRQEPASAQLEPCLRVFGEDVVHIAVVGAGRLCDAVFAFREDGTILVYRFIDLYPCSRPCVMLSHGQQIETGETALDLGGSQLA